MREYLPIFLQVIVAQVLGDSSQQDVLLDDTQVNDNVRQRFAGGLVLLVKFIELRRLNHALFLEELVDGGAVAGEHLDGVVTSRPGGTAAQCRASEGAQLEPKLLELLPHDVRVLRLFERLVRRD